MKLKNLTAALALCAASLSSGAASLSLVPNQQSVAVGGSVTVDIVISGLTGLNEIVSGFDLNVSYNPGLLVWNVIDLTPGVDALGGLGNVLFGFDATAGHIGGDATSFLTDDDLDLMQGDSFTLMSLTFMGAADGAAFLNFGADPDFDRLVTGRLNNLGNAGVLQLDYVGTCIAVGDGDCNNRVPEPAGYGLAALALLGCGLTTSRRRRPV